MKLTEKTTLQFELWHECNNHCKFCYLGSENRVTPDEAKIKSLNSVISYISNEDLYKKYNCLGYIGGEFFQGQLKNPEVKKLFFDLIRKTNELYKRDLIKQFWITATLTIGKQQDLYDSIRIFDKYDDIWILTSWDTMGRFLNKKCEENWLYHVQNLQKEFPGIKINVTVILTGDLIDKYLRNEFRFKNFEDKYNIHWFFKHPSSFVPTTSRGDYETARKDKKKCNEIIPNFFPEREKFIKFLIKFKEQEPADYWTRLYNIQFRADTLIRHFNDGSDSVNLRSKVDKLDNLDSNPMPCGHSFVYCAYIDSSQCVLCDTQRLSIFD